MYCFKIHDRVQFKDESRARKALGTTAARGTVVAFHRYPDSAMTIAKIQWDHQHPQMNFLVPVQDLIQEIT
jgi:hypothetical protein